MKFPLNWYQTVVFSKHLTKMTKIGLLLPISIALLADFFWSSLVISHEEAISWGHLGLLASFCVMNNNCYHLSSYFRPLTLALPVAGHVCQYKAQTQNYDHPTNCDYLVNSGELGLKLLILYVRWFLHFKSFNF